MLNIFDKFSSIPVVVIIALFISTITFLRQYVRVLSKTSFEQLFQNKEEVIWHKVVVSIYSSIMFNLVIFALSMFVKKTDNAGVENASVIEKTNTYGVIQYIFNSTLVFWSVTLIYLLIIAFSFDIFKKRNIGNRFRTIHRWIIGINGVIFFYGYVIIVLAFFVTDLINIALDYFRATKAVLILLGVPIFCYYLYFELFPKHILLVNKKNKYYRLSIIENQEQVNILAAGLIFLYNINSNQVVLCKENDISLQSSLYVFDKEKGILYRYQKINIEEDNQ